MLNHKKNLVFMFIMSKVVICTFISKCYACQDGKIKDDNSFVMVGHEVEGVKKISKYMANDDL